MTLDYFGQIVSVGDRAVYFPRSNSRFSAIMGTIETVEEDMVRLRIVKSNHARVGDLTRKVASQNVIVVGRNG